MPPRNLSPNRARTSLPTINPKLRDRSAVVQDLSVWCADLGRLLHLTRRHGANSGASRALHQRLVAELVVHVQDHAPITLEITPRSIVIGDEPVFTADNANAPTGERELEHELSWVLHRDGLRSLQLTVGLNDGEAAALLDALLMAAPASATHEDVVTQLWHTGLEHISWRTEEVGAVRDNPLLLRRSVDSTPHVDDWSWPDAAPIDVARRWAELRRDENTHLAAFHSEWDIEHDRPFHEQAETFSRQVLARDPRPETAEALAASIVTWIATAVQSCDWRNAGTAYALLCQLDPTGRRSLEPLTHALGSVDGIAITERLDEAEAQEQARLFAFAVHVGAPALPMLLTILGASSKTRMRAGATTALAYAFADDPTPLGPWLADTRWHVVRNVVFVLGQIGGAAVVPHLAVAARHVDTRVRRAAIHALGQVPHHLRRSVLLTQLDTPDARLLAASLAMLGREPDARVSEAILLRIQAPEFEARPEEHKIAFLTSLADLADHHAIPTLAELLARGGWFARRTPERTAAARTLARIGSPDARTVLEQGLRHRSEAVREACDEALARWGTA
jgi:hypothetical protein